MSESVAVSRAIQLLKHSGIQIDFEAVLAQGYKRLVRAGDRVIDVGAHLGRHLRELHGLVGENGSVIAIEPLPEMYSYLCNQWVKFQNVSILNVALSNFDGEAAFVVARNSLEESGLREKPYNIEGILPEKITVRVAKMDTILSEERNIRFCKVDVEGAEISLLEGALKFLTENRPFLSIEYGRPAYSAYGSNKYTLFDIAHGWQYFCADLYGNLITDREDWGQVCDFSYWDYFLVPYEKADEFKSLMAGG